LGAAIGGSRAGGAQQDCADQRARHLVALAGDDVIRRLVADLVREHEADFLLVRRIFVHAAIDEDQAIGARAGIHRAVRRSHEAPVADADIHLAAHPVGRWPDTGEGGTHDLVHLFVRQHPARRRAAGALHFALGEAEMAVADPRKLVDGTGASAQCTAAPKRQKRSPFH